MSTPSYSTAQAHRTRYVAPVQTDNTPQSTSGKHQVNTATSNDTLYHFLKKFHLDKLADFRAHRLKVTQQPKVYQFGVSE
ncbi:hypothetical protein D5R81_15605 [Parashewanella spongiae]|uniref:Uncharacterized protein n=1 Tax=Parashewanella spongiae TaxID=342950 RepID=A0A3A6TFA9_9GAMM|nr:hypothetical protein [Parashewanella spongiae]MCL1079382.1 hypothetical protein [Parashewanella spongiae]RJY07525.1 hypothetical protein D5R81_15605 [Parashewanella spongiae]